MNDLKVDIRNDGVVQNYFGEQRMDIRIIHEIYDHLAKVVKSIKDNHDCNEQIQTFLINVLDIHTQRFTNIIRPTVIQQQTKLLTWSDSKYEGCPPI